MRLFRQHCYESYSHWYVQALSKLIMFPKGEGRNVLMNELTEVETKVTGIPIEQKSPFEEQNSTERN